MPVDAPTAERLTELEVRVAYQDKTIAELDAVVRDYSDRVVVLEREVKRLHEELIRGAPQTGPHDDPPPHY